MLACASVDSSNPQFAEVTLTYSTVTEGVCTTSQQRLFDRTRKFSAPTAIALGPLEETLFGLMSCRTDCGSEPTLQIKRSPLKEVSFKGGSLDLRRRFLVKIQMTVRLFAVSVRFHQKHVGTAISFSHPRVKMSRRR